MNTKTETKQEKPDAAKAAKPSGVFRYRIDAAVGDYKSGDVVTLSARKAKALGITAKNSTRLKGL